MTSGGSSSRPRGNVLATFKIPLGLNEAELTFTGERLEPEDFDALADYVSIFKKQYERKRRLSQSHSSALNEESKSSHDSES